MELMFLKVLMLIRQLHQEHALFVTISNFSMEGLSSN